MTESHGHKHVGFEYGQRTPDRLQHNGAPSENIGAPKTAEELMLEKEWNTKEYRTIAPFHDFVYGGTCTASDKEQKDIYHQTPRVGLFSSPSHPMPPIPEPNSKLSWPSTSTLSPKSMKDGLHGGIWMVL